MRPLGGSDKFRVHFWADVSFSRCNKERIILSGSSISVGVWSLLFDHCLLAVPFHRQPRGLLHMDMSTPHRKTIIYIRNQTPPIFELKESGRQRLCDCWEKKAKNTSNHNIKVFISKEQTLSANSRATSIQWSWSDPACDGGVFVQFQSAHRIHLIPRLISRAQLHAITHSAQTQAETQIEAGLVQL